MCIVFVITNKGAYNDAPLWNNTLLASVVVVTPYAESLDNTNNGMLVIIQPSNSTILVVSSYVAATSLFVLVVRSVFVLSMASGLFG